MNILAKLFWLPFNDRVVDSAVVPGLAKTLGSIVKAQGLPHICLSDELLDDLLVEAIERAQAAGVDGKLRYRQLWQKIEEVADAVTCSYKGSGVPDTVVASILKKHR